MSFDMAMWSRLSQIAVSMGFDLPPDWRGCDPVWPLLERMRSEGAVVLIKIDGQRRTGAYTAVATGPGLESSVRADASVLEEALADLIVRYAQLHWRAEGESP